MEAVKTQDVSVNDLTWKIEYNADRCTMCGSCVAMLLPFLLLLKASQCHSIVTVPVLL